MGLGQWACGVLQQPLHTARHARVADPEHIALPLHGLLAGVLKGRIHALHHGGQVLAVAGSVLGKVCCPGIDVGAGQGVPGQAFPAAKVQLLQADIGFGG
jgi:hypothetical protein